MNPPATTAPVAQTAPAVTGGDPGGAGAPEGNAFVMSQLAGHKAGAGRSGAPKDKETAKKRHEADLTAVARLLAAGQAVIPDPGAGLDSRANLFHNSAEWVASGSMDVYVLSRVHDEHKRPSVPEGAAAYFDTRVETTISGGTASSPGADYDASVDADGLATNDAGLVFEFEETAAMVENHQVAFLAPSRRDEGQLVETLIHEVQHDADQHESGRAAFTPAGGGSDPNSKTVAPAEAWATYQSEVRAFWLQSPEGSSGDNFMGVKDKLEQQTVSTTDPASGATLTATTKFKNARQTQIFLEMITLSHGVFIDPSTHEFVGPYGYVGHYYVVDKAFRKMVDAYDVPDAGNAINSIRIQALSDALATGVWANVGPAASALDALDREYLSDRRASNHLWAQAQASLSADDFASFEDSVGQMYGPWESARVTTQRGDTLWKLALRFFEEGERWKDFKTANPGIKLPKKAKDAVTAGLELVIPKD